VAPTEVPAARPEVVVPQQEQRKSPSVADNEYIHQMKVINQEMIQMVKGLLAKARDAETYHRDDDIQAYLTVIRTFNEKGEQMMQKLHTEIKAKQVEINSLLMQQKDYIGEIVPRTYHHYKDIKEMTYNTLP
jgi:hypothetical protein